MIRFYFHPTPNPAKVALFLEEAGLAYEMVPVDTRRGEQHLPAFRAINPNGKVPAIDARPAVARARIVGKEHAFKTETDEETRRALFPSNYPAVAE